jgi:hypothetical protein
LRILIAVLLLGLVGLGVLYHLSKRTPSRYLPNALTEEQIREAARRVDTQKVPELLNFANKAHAAAAAARNSQARGQAVPPNATQPAPLTLSFTQDEINSSLIKWSQQYKGTIERYVTQPYVALDEGQIILMGTVPELGRVVSMYLAPKVDEKGQFHCDANNVYLGSLPIPDSMFKTYRAKLENSLKSKMPGWQKGSKIDTGGAANPDARALILSRLVLQLLNRESGPAVLFLPRRPEDWNNTVPVRLTEVKIDKEAVTITVNPTSAEERAALAEQIREPLQSAGTNGAGAEQ